jgi:hypothetical protein
MFRMALWPQKNGGFWNGGSFEAVCGNGDTLFEPLFRCSDSMATGG